MTRKYKQAGYQEGARSGRRDMRETGHSSGRPEREGPRGRGLGAPTATVFRCGHCAKKLEFGAPLEPDAACLHCGGDLHTCVHCSHFDTSSRFECREEIPERMASKVKRNSCELFEAKQAQEFASEPENTNDAKSAFDDLFNF